MTLVVRGVLDDVEHQHPGVAGGRDLLGDVHAQEPPLLGRAAHALFAGRGDVERGANVG
jgi:hypothetical protein